MRTNVAAYDTVILGAGVFETRGAWNGACSPNDGFLLKEGLTIIGTGSGGGGTEIRLVDAPLSSCSTSTTGFNYVLASAPGHCGDPDVDNVTLQHFTVNCNAVQVMSNIGTSYLTVGGIRLLGDGTYINNVEVINAASERTAAGCATDEVWGILVGCRTKSAHVEVSSSTFSDFYNPTTYGHTTAIHVSGTATYHPTAFILGNSVYLNGKEGEFAFGVAAHGETYIYWNQVWGADRAVNHDTGTAGGTLSVGFNQFHLSDSQPAAGVFLSANSFGEIEGNEINLYVASSAGLHWHGNLASDWNVVGNTIRSFIGGTNQPYGVLVQNVSGVPSNLNFESNRISEGLTNIVNVSGSYTFDDNKKIDSTGTITGTAIGFPN
ncbi:MAG: hypothetical protein KF833_11390 [Verrucomicrobiae bacterium]|nr:hypothetical protein [Verrucomicrobiae bacterium]